MKFRPFIVQPKPKQANLQIISPSLLSDPAFSADPHSNPYFVTSHETSWQSALPVGHPTLKNKSRRGHAHLAADDGTIDTEFHLIQPPNSPVDPSGPSQPPSFLLAHGALASLPTLNLKGPPSLAASSSLNTRATDSTVIISTSEQTLILPPAPLPTPPAKAEKSIMTFLTRRKVSQSVGSPSLPKSSKEPASVVRDVTRRPSAHRQVTEPIIPHNFERPVLPSRPATTGTSTPVSMSTSTNGSAASKRHLEGLGGRLQDLDRIDELDETNPWGIAMHHGGPYEAATQAIRRGDRKMPLGFANDNAADYHKRAMQAHGNKYIPPQAPIGVSLNLSPGEILPRDFLAQNGNVSQIRDKRQSQPTTPHAYMMRPPPSNPSLPPTSRRHSHAPAPMTPQANLQTLPDLSSQPIPNPYSQPNLQPLPNLHSRPNPQLVSNFYSPLPNAHLNVYSPPPNPQPLPNTRAPSNLTRSPSQQAILSLHRPPRQDPRNAPKQVHKLVAQDNFQIGMAMFDQEPSESSPIQVFLHPTAEEREFDPYDPAHLEIERQRTPSPARNPHLDVSHELAAVPVAHKTQPGPAMSVNTSDSSGEEVELPAEQRGSPPPYASPTSEDDALQHAQVSHTFAVAPDAAQNRSRASSRNSSPGRGPLGTSEETASSESHHRGRMMSPQKIPTPEPRVVRTQINLAQANMPPLANPMSPPQGVQRTLPSLRSEVDRDVRSTHQSISTHSSGQTTRSDRPPPLNKHLPKRLVMPAPLNTGLAPIVSQGSYNPPTARLPPRQLPQQQQPQTHYRPPQQMYPPPPPSQRQMYSPPRQAYPAPRALSPPYAMGPPRAPPPPVQHVVKAQEFHIAKGAKLKKRMSMITTPSSTPSAPILTTVSFAPPIIGFNRGISDEKILGRSKTEKVIPKRLLSKRRTGI